jgi:hypothetical protein
MTSPANPTPPVLQSRNKNACHSIFFAFIALRTLCNCVDKCFTWKLSLFNQLRTLGPNYRGEGVYCQENNRLVPTVERTNFPDAPELARFRPRGKC